MIIEYEVECFQRTLQIKFPDGYESAEGEILQLLDEYYCYWHDVENIKDPIEQKIVQDACLEEYMMSRLSEKYDQWTEWNSINWELRCKHCGAIIDGDDESLWAHIQLEHEEIFEEVQDLETPFMIEECYEEVE